MPGLLDIAPATIEVHGVSVPGISAHGVSYILRTFPDVRKLMAGQELKLSVDDIIMLAPEAVAAIIACGCGYVPNGKEGSAERQENAEIAASLLNVGMQVDFIDAILRITMPGGVGPFMAKLEKLGAFAAEGFGNIAVTNSAPQS